MWPQVAVAEMAAGCKAVRARRGGVRGKAALIGRGGCRFVTMAKRLQDAGATAVIVINNEDTGFVKMGATEVIKPLVRPFTPGQFSFLP